MSHDYIDDANNAVAEQETDPLSLSEYLDVLFDFPASAAHSSRYLLNAIRAAGTRGVVENGVEKTRWCFFDDPHGGGEHALVGHTELTNQFVSDLQRMAEDPDKQKAFWLNGPTASGKSAFKHCLVNGLRAYSLTEEGRRYTVEWNIATLSGGENIPFGRRTNAALDEENWYRSPVQPHPLTVFPETVRQDILRALSDKSEYELHLDSELDPFSQEAWDVLKAHYGATRQTLFKDITAPSHLRVHAYPVDIGSGIGVLSAEDQGTPSELLVGTWLDPLLRTLPYRGRKNPQAFSYDGLLAQGNSGLSIIEDAGLHAETVQHLLSVPEEQSVQIDRQFSLDVDTVLFIISNPDLATYLESFLDNEIGDPLRPLRRRLHRYDLNYLMDPALENELLRRKLTGTTDIWQSHLRPDLEAPLTIDGTEVAPHTIEAAAFYNLITRFDGVGVPEEMSFLDKAMLAERGYILSVDGKPQTTDDFHFGDNLIDGSLGIPTTYTHAVFDKLIDRGVPILPHDIVRALHSELANDPVYSDDEIEEYRWRAKFVLPYVVGKQTGDMKAALCAGLDPEAVGAYLTNIIDWASDSSSIDEEVLRVAETTLFGWENPGNDMSRKEFRRSLLRGLNHYLWDSRTPPSSTAEIDVYDAQTQQTVFKTLTWNNVLRRWPGVDFNQWRNPQPETPTATTKEACIAALSDSFGYSEASAKRMTEFVVEQELATRPKDD